MLLQISDEAVKDALSLMAASVRQRRLSMGHTQAKQAKLAEISLRAAQNIEAGLPGQTGVLLKYLFSLDMLSELLALFSAVDEGQKQQRVSRSQLVAMPNWGDGLGDRLPEGVGEGL